MEEAWRGYTFSGNGEESLLPREMMTGWSTAQEILRLWVNKGDMMIELPQRKLEAHRQRLMIWLPERRDAIIREVYR